MSAVAPADLMSADDARRLTERIRYKAMSVREGMEGLQILVQQAKDGNAHVALGYASWTAYIADAMGEQPLRLERDQRQELVGYLAAEGMSTRAIAPVVGASQTTVMEDLSRLNGNRSVDRPATVTSLDGRQRPATQPPRTPALHELHQVVEEFGVDLDDDSPTPTVVSERAIEATKAAPRRALTDAFFDAIYDLQKVTERIGRLAADDRFPRNADQVAAKHRSDLIRARDVLQDVINRLPSA